MSNFVDLLGSYISKYVARFFSTAQAQNGGIDPSKKPHPEMVKIIDKVGAEGTILLQNNEHLLPLKKDKKVAIFGRCQIDTLCVGYGSGGDVITYYKKNIIDSFVNNNDFDINSVFKESYKEFAINHPLSNKGWGEWPFNYEEMLLEESFIKDNKREDETAIIIIGRASGEDRDNVLKEGSYFLTSEEHKMLECVTSLYKEVVLVLNIGNIIDFSFLNKYPISSVLLAYQGGMETGEIIERVIAGKDSPTGKLPFTIAKNYRDYPSSQNFGHRYKNFYKEDIYVGYRFFETFKKDSVIFPFGFGLNYSSFDVKVLSIMNDSYKTTIRISVENTGDYIDQEVVQIYLEKPSYNIDEPKLILVGFKKTKDLKPREKQFFAIDINLLDFSSFSDDDPDKSFYAIFGGVYKFYLGNSVRNVRLINKEYFPSNFIKDTLLISNQKYHFKRLKNDFGNVRFSKTDKYNIDLKNRIIEDIPKSYSLQPTKQYHLSMVENGQISLEEFVSSLSLEEMEALSRGDKIMNSPLGAKGNAAVFGGVTKSLEEKGIRPISVCDGPSGIRLKATSSLLPIGLMVSSTWNPELVNKLYSQVALEMKERDVEVLLGPGMNIIRNPLCGRNFEYYSEDPFLSASIGIGMVNGIQENGCGVAIKHFACNNQEFNRTFNNSIVSERALREIYLRNFEKVVKEAKPFSVMTSYNKINSVYAHYNYGLNNVFLRKECAFDGLIMTDWWMRDARDPNFRKLFRQAYRIRSGVNLLMPGAKMFGKPGNDGTLLKSLGKKNGITIGEIERNSEYILSSIISLDLKAKKEEDSIKEKNKFL